MHADTQSPNSPSNATGVACDDLVVPLREWIVEIPARVVHTMTVQAATRKEAEMKLRNRSEHMDAFTGIDSHVTSCGIGRVVCEDGKKSRHNTTCSQPSKQGNE